MLSTQVDVMQKTSTWQGISPSIQMRFRFKLTGAESASNKQMQPCHRYRTQYMGTPRPSLHPVPLYVPTHMRQRKALQWTSCLSPLCPHNGPVVPTKDRDSTAIAQDLLPTPTQRKCRPTKGNRTPRSLSRLQRRHSPWSTTPPPMYNHTFRRHIRLSPMKPQTGQMALAFPWARVASPHHWAT